MSKTFAKNLQSLSRTISSCTACPRLRSHCTQVAREKRRAYINEQYWGKPISGFGDPSAELVIVGLAPAAHGANRTGRIFTGDRSGDWLYGALHHFGFANQPSSTHRDDGLILQNAYITCVVKCAPPDNKPTPAEQHQCENFLAQELKLLPQARVYLALGQFALNGLWSNLGEVQAKPRFAHGGVSQLKAGRKLFLSYHPSQQNTFTGRLTGEMFHSVFAEIKTFMASRTHAGKDGEALV